MNEISKQVNQARRRLNFQKFLSVIFWSAFVGLSIACVGVAIKKIWPVAVESHVWQWSWIGGSLGTSLLVAIVLTVVRRRSSLDAAIEIDKRFQLKERVSSCLSLSETERDTEAGKALVQDAVRRAAEVNVADEFKVAPNKWAWAPFAMAAFVFGLTFLADAQPESISNKANAAIVPISKKKINNSTKDLKKKLAERKKKALEDGLEDASEVFKKLEMGVDSLRNKDGLDKKDALVKLNDLSQEIKRRKNSLGDPKALRKQLSQLKDLKQGPANKLAEALKSSNFKAALDAINDLRNEMNMGKLSEQQKKALEQQISQMQQKLQEMVAAHNQEKRDLERQIQQKMDSGDRKAAAELQEKLDRLSQQDQQMKKMSQLAQKLGDAQQGMKNGDGQKASEALGELAQAVESMQQEMDELEMLDGALAQLDGAKEAMNCEGCDGEGCSSCQSMGMGMNGMGMNGQIPGMGMGDGQGQGDRPEEETGTDFYDSQVRAKPGKGKAVVIGSANGKNRKGLVLEEIKSEVASVSESNDDPLTGVRLPKRQRDLTKEYFERLRQGK